ncbi:MAG TPA: T9SS type A sorting domain-containing protein [bacterium]|nr:T9SS type A sorting domain-containing protein [bacterium]
MRQKFNKLLKTVFILFTFMAFIYAENQFSAVKTIDRTQLQNPEYITAVDMDDDGDNDLLTGAYRKIVWFENDGTGNFAEQQILTNSGAESICPVDFDDNGMLDILYLSENQVFLIINQGAGSFSEPQLIFDSLAASGIYMADMNGNDTLDFIYHNETSIGWFENTGEGDFGVENMISDSACGIRSLLMSDVDDDQDNDIIFFTFRDVPIGNSELEVDNKIAWYENKGAGQFEQPQLIYDGIVDAIYGSDINGDRIVDLIFTENDRLSYYLNYGQGEFGDSVLVPDLTGRKAAVTVQDLNNDNYQDIIYFSSGIEDYSVCWLKNNLNQGFESPVIIQDSVYSISSIEAEDMDDDQDFDIFYASKANDEIAWFENIDGEGKFEEEKIITTRINPRFLCQGDIDNDGDADLLWASLIDASYLDNRIVWYKNTDGQGNFGKIKIVEKTGVHGVQLADLEGDSDLDIFYSIDFLSKRALYCLINKGDGDFRDSQKIIANVTDPFLIIDLNNDNRKDVLYSGWGLNWHENLGEGEFCQGKGIVRDAILLDTADVNRDGRFDIIVCSNAQDSLFWVQNKGGGNFSDCKFLYDLKIHSFDNIKFADLNNDNTIDILNNQYFNNTVKWYKNEGDQTFSDSTTIDDSAYHVRDIVVSDFDRDGDQDVLFSSSNNSIWYKNDGIGNFIKQNEITSSAATAFCPADFNNDGYLDLAWGSMEKGIVAWNENLKLSKNEPHEKKIADHFILRQNYPNPFNPTTRLRYNLPKREKVTISIFDVNGKHIETLVNKFQSPGNHTIHWNASGLSSGIYFYKIEAGDYINYQKCTLIK